MASSATDHIPEKWLGILIQYIMMFQNETTDFQKPHLRKTLIYVYPLFIFLYAFVVLVGTVGNICVLVTIFRRRLYDDPTYWFLGNIAFSDIIKCLIVLPVTLANLLIQNWVFGSFLCYFLPMLQDIPIHASMLSFVLIAVDRYRIILYPIRSRLPPFICTLGVWVLSICVVLPFAIYTTYFDLEAIFGPQFTGTGICAINVNEDIEEYLRGLFIALYVLPLTVIALLYVRVSGEIKSREHPLPLVYFETSEDGGSHVTTVTAMRSTSVSEVTVSLPDETTPSEKASKPTSPPVSTRQSSSKRKFPNSSSQNAQQERGRRAEDEDDVDPLKEKRTQKYLITMVTIFAICLCPLYILRLVKHIVIETYDNTGHFDLTFIIVVWICFLHTCTTPILFASWRLSRPTKDRLKGYFRFSNKRPRERRRSRASLVGHTEAHSNKAFALTNGHAPGQYLETQPVLTSHTTSRPLINR